MKVILFSLILAFMLGSTSVFAYSIYEKQSWGYQVKCNNGSIHGVKQKSNGKWTDTSSNQNFDSMDTAAKFSCSE